ncbi:VOC family protein [Pseudoalteromonas fenneropenaei]|uniref:VOC family protein n=1 Tax=Pseudoalteromonas fenneropenaei TaxID=1737459 RepID=A0ABV7CGH3_9GAMM
MSVPAIPAGYHSLTPYLVVAGANEAISFYQTAFGATLKLKMDTPDGKVAHAELLIGNSHLMLSDGCDDINFKSPHELGGTPVSLMCYVDNVDTVFATALAAGAKELRPVVDQFYGDRSGTLQDPFGHLWTISTHMEELSEQELQQRLAAMMGEGQQ